MKPLLKKDDLKNRALNLLTRREHSKKELAEKLKARGFEENVETVIEALAEKNLQSDARFAECFVRARAAKGYGPARIEEELKLRGVDKEDIALALQEIDWAQIQEKQAQKLQTKFDLNTREGKLKLKQALYMRGFVLEGGFR